MILSVDILFLKIIKPSHNCIFKLLYLLASSTMRYYEARYPEVDELVMVQVRQIAEMGAYVKLVRPSELALSRLHYNGQEKNSSNMTTSRG